MNPLQCPICLSHYFRIVSLKAPEYCICEDCGHVYHARLYEDDYYHNLPCSFPKDYEEHAVRRANYILDFILKEPCPSFKRVIDIGCGPGSVMRAIQKRLPDAVVHGCTISPQSDPNIITMDVENDDFPDNTEPYDLIIMSHVVEHFFHPVETLNKLRKLLSPRGYMYIEVPSFNWAEVRIPSVFTPEHMSFFTPNSLDNVLKSSGLFAAGGMKESKYWGNIKTIAINCGEGVRTIKKVDYRKVLRYNRFIKLLYPWYRTMHKIRKVGANE